MTHQLQTWCLQEICWRLGLCQHVWTEVHHAKMECGSPKWDDSALKGGLLLLLALVTWMNATTGDITCNNEGGPTTNQVVYGLHSPTRNCETSYSKVTYFSQQYWGEKGIKIRIKPISNFRSVSSQKNICPSTRKRKTVYQHYFTIEQKQITLLLRIQK